MSIETYENIYNREKLYKELEISERQIEENKVIDAVSTLDSMKKKYAL